MYLGNQSSSGLGRSNGRFIHTFNEYHATKYFIFWRVLCTVMISIAAFPWQSSSKAGSYHARENLESLDAAWASCRQWYQLLFPCTKIWACRGNREECLASGYLPPSHSRWYFYLSRRFEKGSQWAGRCAFDRICNIKHILVDYWHIWAYFNIFSNLFSIFVAYFILYAHIWAYLINMRHIFLVLSIFFIICAYFEHIF